MLIGIGPVLTANGIATENEVKVESFIERVRAELGPDPLLVVSRLMVMGAALSDARPIDPRFAGITSRVVVTIGIHIWRSQLFAR